MWVRMRVKGALPFTCSKIYLKMYVKFVHVPTCVFFPPFLEPYSPSPARWIKRLFLCMNVYGCWALLVRGPCYCTWLDVVPDDADVLVSIRPCVFVPEADHMSQLVHHDAKFVTVFTDGYSLGASSSASHVWTASMNHHIQTQVETDIKIPESMLQGWNDY